MRKETKVQFQDHLNLHIYAEANEIFPKIKMRQEE